MEECFVTPSETAAIVLEGLRWHRRIAESRMAFDVRWSSLINIAPSGFESIVKPMPRYFRKLWRWRWLNIYRVWMRTASQGKGQQQRRHSKPFLHVMSSVVGFDVPPICWRDICRYQPMTEKSVVAEPMRRVTVVANSERIQDDSALVTL
jgi:hypothetical protein